MNDEKTIYTYKCEMLNNFTYKLVRIRSETAVKSTRLDWLSSKAQVQHAIQNEGANNCNFVLPQIDLVIFNASRTYSIFSISAYVV